MVLHYVLLNYWVGVLRCDMRWLKAKKMKFISEYALIWILDLGPHLELQ